MIIITVKKVRKRIKRNITKSNWHHNRSDEVDVSDKFWHSVVIECYVVCALRYIISNITFGKSDLMSSWKIANNQRYNSLKSFSTSKSSNTSIEQYRFAPNQDTLALDNVLAKNLNHSWNIGLTLNHERYKIRIISCWVRRELGID